jgi:hypothetical protein
MVRLVITYGFWHQGCYYDNLYSQEMRTNLAWVSVIVIPFYLSGCHYPRKFPTIIPRPHLASSLVSFQNDSQSTRRNNNTIALKSHMIISFPRHEVALFGSQLIDWGSARDLHCNLPQKGTAASFYIAHTDTDITTVPSTKKTRIRNSTTPHLSTASDS